MEWGVLSRTGEFLLVFGGILPITLGVVLVVFIIGEATKSEPDALVACRLTVFTIMALALLVLGAVVLTTRLT